ncbi:MAG TPA: hypothetical protein VNS32_22890 [Flavisolibacter sp.]|nr:hypothetical protein [Flavisolibacter sp.]
MEERNISHQESMQIITEMIGKAKQGFHESGISAVLWGSVIGLCGLVNFAETYWHFYIGFNIWLLTLAAIIPQVVISIRESRQRKVLTHIEWAADVVWIVYAISIFALNFYISTVPNVPSLFSLFLLLYAIPTLACGILYKFKIMMWAGLLCYGFFVISCFTPTVYDMLLNGLAGIFNWLIPGLILRRRIYKKKKAMHV